MVRRGDCRRQHRQIPQLVSQATDLSMVDIDSSFKHDPAYAVINPLSDLVVAQAAGTVNYLTTWRRPYEEKRRVVQHDTS